MGKRTAVIFGVTGQDGSYLTKLLLKKGYEVHGISRRVSVDTTERIKSYLTHANFSLHMGDVTDGPLVFKLIQTLQPDEVYNLAAQSHVAVSFTNAASTFLINAIGPLNMLEAIRCECPTARFYQASTSEMFGSNYSVLKLGRFEKVGEDKFQDEDTPMSPNSPYAVAKLGAHELVHVYRKSYGVHASAGILFNHESELRGNHFVTRKITRYVGALKRYLLSKKMDDHILTDKMVKFALENMEVSTDATHEGFPVLRMGNMTTYRDWGHAEDYVRAMWLMLQQETPDDYVVATGKTHSITDFTNVAFRHIGVDNWNSYVVVDPQFYRPSDVEYLRGSAAKAHKVLNWKPKVSFETLVHRMVDHDYDLCRQEIQSVV